MIDFKENPNKNNFILPEIIFEDNHLLVINKLNSQIVQGDKTGDSPLSEMLKEYIKKKYNKPGNVFLGVVHRIDRPASGLVIFAKTSKSLSRLNQMIQNREIKKTYWAVVKTQPPLDSGHLINFLKKNEKLNKSFVCEESVKDSHRAELYYKLIGKSNNYFLLEINLITGRHHQIRTQLAHIGCPIKGDIKYGFPRTNPNGSIHLHAQKIEFIHPVKQDFISLTCNPPVDNVWKAFSI